MSDIYRCENCRFSVKVPTEHPSQTEFGNLACVRYPPSIRILGEDGFGRSALTPVNHNWWCGEWANLPVRIVPKEILAKPGSITEVDDPWWRKLW